MKKVEYRDALAAAKSAGTVGVADAMALTGHGETTIRRMVRRGELATAPGTARNVRILARPLLRQLGLEED